MSAMTPRNPAGAPLLKSASFKARFWDRMASGYAGGTIGDWAGYERSLARTRELLGPDASVLEIGCGTGATALTLSLFTGPYLATDIAPQMIALANQRLALSPRPELRFQVDDSDASASEAAGPFDAVLAFNVLHLLDDLDAATARCARVLRPGGLFITKTACLGEMNPLIPGLAVPLMRAGSSGAAGAECCARPTWWPPASARAWRCWAWSAMPAGAVTCGLLSWRASRSRPARTSPGAPRDERRRASSACHAPPSLAGGRGRAAGGWAPRGGGT